MKALKAKFELLKKYMADKVPVGSDIEVWNAAREEAKSAFSQEVISLLDASGYVTELIK